ncbi:hypothetical protein SOASR030_22290 [Leminorella grimontii]|uniref:Uncharacterized protein n=1 Tax=Leminorella grimontii TaxID=82981 RepID=A0AAV5N6V3_9GAMM|nr:hypothetical protein SOASR030_22290 [Leminorella grimontii]GKX59176.1 hypothetical protein SOASR031_14910 [Leminorella grimontii]
MIAAIAIASNDSRNNKNTAHQIYLHRFFLKEGKPRRQQQKATPRLLTKNCVREEESANGLCEEMRKIDKPPSKKQKARSG